MSMTTSCYIHIPFCDDICSYCDFCKIYKRSGHVEKYLDALEQEICQNYQGEVLKTIYIGGGTPSSLSTDELERLFQILECLRKDKKIEYNIECNIESITREKLELFLKAGINRISIGIQTVDELSIQKLNRHHSKETVLETIQLVKEVGFSNINVDFMYAFPWQTKEMFLNDLQFFLSLDVPHISTYSLILEEHTVLGNEKMNPLDEEVEVWMYQTIREQLSKLGYNHYEVSNFAKPNYESKHNLVYWNNEPYYGFGVGASGYVQQIRYENTRSLPKYESGKRILESHTVMKREDMENECILGLRKMSGISKDVFKEKFHEEIEQVFPIEQLKRKKLLEEKDGFLFIPEDKIYISNEILIEFLQQ